MTKYGWILNAIMGLVLMAAGGWLLYQEVAHPPTHNAHIYVFVGIALLGALLINPTPIIGTVKQVVIVILPILPWSKAQLAARQSGALPPAGDAK